MADFSLPTTSSLYSDLVSILKDRDVDIATMFRSGTATNIPTNAVRWEPTNRRFEVFNGTIWAELSTSYNISADRLGGKSANQFMDLTTAQTKNAKLSLSGVADVLDLKGGTADYVYLSFFADAAVQTSLSATIGFKAAASLDLSIRNHRPDGNLLLQTNSAVATKGVVSINGNILFDRGHGNASSGSDIYFTGAGLIAAEDHLFFNIDALNAANAAKFSWIIDSETASGTEVMSLSQEGILTLPSGQALFKAPSTVSRSSLALDQPQATQYHVEYRVNGLVKWYMRGNSSDFTIRNVVTSNNVLKFIASNDDLYINTTYSRIGKSGTGSTYLGFLDDNISNYRFIRWNTANNWFDAQNSSGQYSKLLTKEDINPFPVATGTGVSGTTSGYWFKIVTVVLSAQHNEATIVFDMASAGFGASARASVFLRNVIGGTTVNEANATIIISEKSVNQPVISNGELKIIQKGTAPAVSTDSHTYEIWFKMGTAYSSISVYDIRKRLSGNATITWAGDNVVTNIVPTSDYGIEVTATKSLAVDNLKTSILSDLHVKGLTPTFELISSTTDSGNGTAFLAFRNSTNSQDIQIKHVQSDTAIPNGGKALRVTHFGANTDSIKFIVDGQILSTQYFGVIGTSSGSANVSYLRFYNSDGTSHAGSIGFTSSSTSTMYLWSAEPGSDIRVLQQRSDDSGYNTSARFTSNGVVLYYSNAIKFQTIPNGARIGGSSTGAANLAMLEFYESNGTVRQGYIGFGSSGNSSLYIQNDVNLQYIYFQAKTGSGLYRTVARFGGNIPYALLYYDGSSRLSTTSDGITVTGIGTATDWVSTSDIRIKSNLEPITDAINKVMCLTGYTFNKKDSDKRFAGIIAQELLNVLPEGVSDGDVLGVSSQATIALLIQAFKDLVEEVRK